MTWTTIAANWNNGCAVESRARPAVDPGLAFTVLRTACEPYLRGMRHYALPSVSFEADGELISAPGDWLPSSGDSDLDGYRARLSSRAANWRLRVVEPLFTDYRLWHRVREQLTPLWSAVGMPVLPVASELIVAAGDVRLCESEASHLNLVFVLDGRVTLLDDGTEQELSEEDVVRIPAAGTAALRASTASLSLRLRIPVDRRLPTADAVRLISRVVAAEAAELDEPVPELSFPPPTDGEELKLPAETGAPQRPPHRADYRAEAERLSRVWWAGRASAAGLDPVPDPAEPPPLRPEQRVRARVPVLVLPGEEPDQQLWAVNGMAFSVAGPTPESVLDRLRGNASVEMADLCRDADGQDNGAGPLLNRLCELRAIEIVEETP